jgi:hypothetical protein
MQEEQKKGVKILVIGVIVVTLIALMAGIFLGREPEMSKDELCRGRGYESYNETKTMTGEPFIGCCASYCNMTLCKRYDVAIKQDLKKEDFPYVCEVDE